MKRTSVAGGLILAAILSGCVSTGGFDELPQQDQSRFFRCRHAMQPVICGDDRDEVYVTMCIRTAEANYSEKGPQGRKTWLVEQGCPASMVSPAAYVAADPPDAPVARRPRPMATPAPDEEEPATPPPPAPPRATGQAADDEAAK